jgi:transposase-like protein
VKRNYHTIEKQGKLNARKLSEFLSKSGQRAHKLRNGMDHLPEDQKDQVKSAMRAAWRLDAKGGMARMKELAEWLEQDYPSAAASLTEGLEECFTIHRLDVPPSLHRCLATTNVIERPPFRCSHANAPSLSLA